MHRCTHSSCAQDAKWHDGEPVTANDVVETVRFILTQATNINPRRWISSVKGGQAFYDGETDELAWCLCTG